MKSGRTEKLGTLVMLSTHIGNVQDIPSRSLLELQHADLLVFEEDGPARKALKAAGIQRSYLKYSEHRQQDTLSKIKEALSTGSRVAYMSDQGCPTFEDPGERIAILAYEVGARVTVVPGPSCLTTAIAACPFPLNEFYYVGFLPVKEPLRKQKIKSLVIRLEPMIILDTPYRLDKLLKELLKAFGNRRAFLAIDMTKKNEFYLSGTLKCISQQASEALVPAEGTKESCKSSRIKPNFVFIIDRPDRVTHKYSSITNY